MCDSLAEPKKVSFRIVSAVDFVRIFLSVSFPSVSDPLTFWWQEHLHISNLLGVDRLYVVLLSTVKSN